MAMDKVILKIAMRFKDAVDRGDDPYRATDGMTESLKTLIAGRKLGYQMAQADSQDN